jgi:hypothetical protein
VILFEVMGLAKLSCMLVTGAVWLVAARAGAAETRYFSHADERYLYAHQHKGAAALLPENAEPGSAVPLVIFLHGTNSIGEPHLWLGGGRRDLRPVAARLMKERSVRPFVLAGPSQTKGASLARTLWGGFDLDAFVQDIVAATKDAVQIDLHRVLVAGHSGAGCNPTGGLARELGTAGSITPVAVVSIDPCLDEEMGNAFAKRPAEVPLLIWWQSAIWARDPEAFWSALTAGKPRARLDRMTRLLARGPNPHDAIVPLAFEQMLRELLPKDASGAEDDTA